MVHKSLNWGMGSGSRTDVGQPRELVETPAPEALEREGLCCAHGCLLCSSNGPARIDDKLIRVMEPVGSIPRAHFSKLRRHLFRNRDEEAGVGGLAVSNSPHLIGRLRSFDLRARHVQLTLTLNTLASQQARINPFFMSFAIAPACYVW